jgi:hypothetical protein
MGANPTKFWPRNNSDTQMGETPTKYWPRNNFNSSLGITPTAKKSISDTKI